MVDFSPFKVKALAREYAKKFNTGETKMVDFSVDNFKILLTIENGKVYSVRIIDENERHWFPDFS